MVEAVHSMGRAAVIRHLHLIILSVICASCGSSEDPNKNAGVMNGRACDGTVRAPAHLPVGRYRQLNPSTDVMVSTMMPTAKLTKMTRKGCAIQNALLGFNVA